MATTPETAVGARAKYEPVKCGISLGKLLVMAAATAADVPRSMASNFFRRSGPARCHRCRIVDDQFAPLAEKIKAALKGITDKPVKFVLNTHWHFDHNGGNAYFGATAPIIAHENVRKRLQSGGNISAFKMEVPPAPKAALPVVTFDDKVTVHINGEDIRAIHFPKQKRCAIVPETMTQWFNDSDLSKPHFGLKTRSPQSALETKQPWARRRFRQASRSLSST